MRNLKVVVAACLLLALGTSSRATIIGYDSFVTTGSSPSSPNGYTPGNVYGQNPAFGDYGFSGPYTNTTSGTGAVQAVNTGLSAGADNATGGGSVEVYTDYNSSGSGINRGVYRPLAAYTPSGTYYFSGLAKAPATLNAGAQTVLGFSNNATPSVNGTSVIPASASGLFFGFDGSNFEVWANSTAGAMTENPISSITAGSTSFFVAKLVYGSPTSTALSVWLNPTNTSSEGAMGMPTLSLTTGALADNTNDDITYFNLGVNTSAVNSTMATFTDPAYFDEPRFSTDFNTVINAPEPASLGIFAVAALACLTRRRNGRRSQAFPSCLNLGF